MKFLAAKVNIIYLLAVDCRCVRGVGVIPYAARASSFLLYKTVQNFTHPPPHSPAAAAKRLFICIVSFLELAHGNLKTPYKPLLFCREGKIIFTSWTGITDQKATTWIN